MFVGDKGDTDYEDLVSGLHKTIVLKSSVMHGSEGLLRGEEGCKSDDVVPSESPNTVYVEEGFGVHEISAALESVGMK